MSGSWRENNLRLRCLHRLLPGPLLFVSRRKRKNWPHAGVAGNQSDEDCELVEKMTRTTSKIRFSAKLLRPTATAKAGSWTFLVLPKNASAKLPSRGMTTVEGTINGLPFRATLEPDGQRSHWLKVDRKMREAAGADAGDVVTLEIAPSGEEREPRVPADLR